MFKKPLLSNNKRFAILQNIKFIINNQYHNQHFSRNKILNSVQNFQHKIKYFYPYLPFPQLVFLFEKYLFLTTVSSLNISPPLSSLESKPLANIISKLCD